MSSQRSILVGDERIPEMKHHKILGITVNNTLSWTDHVYGRGGVISLVNQRIGALKRLSFNIPKEYLPQISNSIVTSKLRYGLAVYGSVRMSDSDPKTQQQRDLQVALNKALRIVTKVRLADRVPIQELCYRTGALTVNQMCCEDQLRLVWNSLRDESSPLRSLFNTECGPAGMLSRSRAQGKVQQIAKTSVGQRNLPYTAISVWNELETDTKKIEKTSTVKRAIKAYAKTLPI